MKHQCEAYEALVEKLKKELDDLTTEYDDRVTADNATIVCLIDYIFLKLGKDVAMMLAQEAEKEGGKNIVDYVQDLIAEESLGDKG